MTRRGHWEVWTMSTESKSLDNHEVLAVRIGEAARLLSISRSKMYALIRQGQVPAVKIGDSLRVPIADLETWLHDHMTQPEGH